MSQATALGPPRRPALPAIALFLWAGLLPTNSAAACRPIDAAFAGGRVIVLYRTPTGDVLRLLSDTGGGGSLLSTEAASRLGLALEVPPADVLAELGPDARFTSSPAPVPGQLAMPGPVLVVPQVTPLAKWPESLDGVLGQSWFVGGRWTWDYVAETLSTGCEPAGARTDILLPPPDAPPPARQFPRISVQIAGEPVALLFDSGATTWLTDAAQRTLGEDGGAIRATSMITASRAAAWRRDHPDWHFIEAGQQGTGAAMIEAQDVVIAGIDVGPVWFTERPDRNFTALMSTMMAAPVEGALGGNALRGLRVTVDYPGSAAWFERVAPPSRSEDQ